ncbi:hypothetical protein SYNPS1DRAFT_31041 [Syncephalis pseudoplumigaleata]|uniref:Uncharacterized protein n=1 Tax=Syncephalis pseudoplumigaleata TaxID=1712513 RepID=A0A4P9YTV6_9FUNG|nr:hypothetical protein SYNPS1DRAFT_31041 [Syncephalis pseudoplumigaleata]|eukprot:RKP23244.1 hypothetical protein SYNPS1DRAFT_31041 [Syncephalis pseudoplumigaleata]
MRVPGGQVELVEFDGTQLSKGPAAQRMEHWIMQALRRRQLSPEDIHQLPQHLHHAGFVDIERRVVGIPTGCHAGKYGQMAWLGWSSYARIMKGMLLEDGVTAWEFERTMAEWQREVNELPTITQVHIFSARRPGATTAPSAPSSSSLLSSSSQTANTGTENGQPSSLPRSPRMW